HNVVHLLFGVVGLLGLRSRGLAKAYLVVGGIVYAVLWIYGLIVPMETMGNFVPLNTADNWLHFVLAVAMVTTGIVFGRRPRAWPDAGAARSPAQPPRDNGGAPRPLRSAEASADTTVEARGHCARGIFQAVCDSSVFSGLLMPAWVGGPAAMGLVWNRSGCAQ